MKRAIAISLLMLNPSAALAADGEPIVYGTGAASCGRWLEMRRADNYYAYGNWVLGYISAKSEHLRLKDSDSDAMAAWMDKYCAEHPLDTIQKGTVFLLKELYMGPETKAK
jgi:hypothetical protein